MYLESQRPYSYYYEPSVRIWAMDGSDRSVRGPTFTPKTSPTDMPYRLLSSHVASMRRQDVWYVDLADTALDELSLLREFRDLRWLNLCDARVGDVSALYEMRNLKRLWITGATLSDKQVQRLRDALPDCVIYWTEPTDEASSRQDGCIRIVRLLPTD